MADLIPNPQNIVVFDHDRDHLQELGKQLDLHVVEYAAAFRKDEKLAVDALGDNFSLALVHVVPDAWQYLLYKAKQNQVLIRFSTLGFPPAPQELSKALTLRMRLRLKEAEFTLNDLRTVCEQLSLSENIKRLRQGIVPESLTKYFQFPVEPSLNAIAIVCQCYLATLLADPEQHASIPKATQALIGWNRLPAQAQSSLSDRLQQTHAKQNTFSWWAETLGFFDKENDAIDRQQKTRLLIAIISDMDGKAKAETLQEQLTAGGNPSDIETRIFDNADDEYPNAVKVLKLFQHDSVNIDTVCDAYEALAAFLSPGAKANV